MSDRRKGRTKTMPMRESEATLVGTPQGWESDAVTIVGAPEGWEMPSEADDEVVPPDWEVERTVEEQAPAGHARPRKKPSRPPVGKTHAGPPANYDLAAGVPPRERIQTPEGSSAARPMERPPVEVEVRKLSNAAATTRRTPSVYEIWTKNRVYALDATLVCTDVIDLASGQSDKRHPFVGGQLVGGQRQVNENNELTFPLPTPGSEAVFQTYDANRRPRLVVTSRVTRVTLTVMVVRVADTQRDDTWSSIASTRRPA